MAQTVEVIQPPSKEEIFAGFAERLNTKDGGNSWTIFGEGFEKIHDAHQGKKFRFSSMTKPVVAAVVAKFIDEGKINLDDPVSKYLPAFANTKVQAMAPPTRGKGMQWKLYNAAAEVLQNEDPEFIKVIDGRVAELLATYLAHCFGLDFVDLQVTENDGKKSQKKGFKRAADNSTPAEAEVVTGIKGCKVELKEQETPMTLRNLITHTSGLGYGPGMKYLSPKSATHMMYDKLCKKTESGEVRSLEMWVDELAKIPLLNQPGKRREYSYSMDVMGRVLEVVAGKTLDVIVQECVLTPCGMKGTGFIVGSANEMVPLYKKQHKGRGNKGEDDSEEKEEEEEEKEEDEEEGDSKKEPNWELEVLEKDGTEYLSKNSTKVLSAGGGIELVKGGMVGTMPDFVAFCKALLSNKFGFSEETMKMAFETNQLELATGGKVRAWKQGWGWNLFGSLRLDFSEKHKFKDIGEKYLTGAFEWGGFAGTRFMVYPKLNAGFVFMRNAFGFRSNTNAADVTVLQLNGVALKDCLSTVRNPPKQGNFGGNNWKFQGSYNKGKGKGRTSNSKGKGRNGKKWYNNSKGGGKGASKKETETATVRKNLVPLPEGAVV